MIGGLKLEVGCKVASGFFHFSVEKYQSDPEKNDTVFWLLLLAYC